MLLRFVDGERERRLVSSASGRSGDGVARSGVGRSRSSSVRSWGRLTLRLRNSSDIASSASRSMPRSRCSVPIARLEDLLASYRAKNRLRRACSLNLSNITPFGPPAPGEKPGHNGGPAPALWVTIIDVRPCQQMHAPATSSKTWSCVCPEYEGSRWVRRRAGGGRMASARAIATRCCSPPESWSGKCPLRPESPTAASSSSARDLAAAERCPAIRRGEPRCPSVKLVEQVVVLEHEPYRGGFEPGPVPSSTAARRRHRRGSSRPPSGRSRRPSGGAGVLLPPRTAG